MPPYFFDVYDGQGAPDLEGVEYADLNVARREAVKAAGAMLSEQADDWTGGSWRMDVRDEGGAVVAVLDFRVC